MKKLALPTEDDDANLENICQQRAWSQQRTAWKSSYVKYRSSKGNPWLNNPIHTDPDITSALYSLYDTRRGAGYIKRIRETRDLGCCPVCGSGTTGSVDHYLPRTNYPEFSIFSHNLVPACTHCNSSSKGSTIKGYSHKERFIHPYYDRLAGDIIWRITFEPNFLAVKIGYEPMPNLQWKVRRRIRFHLDNVLGVQFYIAMENEWANFLHNVGNENRDAGNAVLTSSFVADHAQYQLNCSSSRGRQNSWYSAFYRGLLANKQAITWISANAS